MSDLPARIPDADSEHRPSTESEKLYAASQWTLMRPEGPRIRFDSRLKDLR